MLLAFVGLVVRMMTTVLEGKLVGLEGRIDGRFEGLEARFESKLEAGLARVERCTTASTAT